MRVAVDTSIIIDHLRGGKKWEDFITTAKQDTELFLPTVVIFELYSGQSTKNHSKEKDISNFIDQFQKIDLSENIAKLAGQLFRDTKGKMQAPDYIVAASALSLGASVLTLNRKHFEQIPVLIVY